MSDKTFWVLERDGQYVSLKDVPTGDRAFSRIATWTDDLRDARHWPTQLHADVVRRHLSHPFWMSDAVEHQMLSPDAYADGLAAVIAAKNEQIAELTRKLTYAYLAILNGFAHGTFDFSVLRQDAETFVGTAAIAKATGAT